MEFVITIHTLSATIYTCANPQEGRAIQPLACTCETAIAYATSIRRPSVEADSPISSPHSQGKPRQISTLECPQCGPGSVQTNCLRVWSRDRICNPKKTARASCFNHHSWKTWFKPLHFTKDLFSTSLYRQNAHVPRLTPSRAPFCLALHLSAPPGQPPPVSKRATRRVCGKRDGLPRMDPLKESGKNPLDAEKDERTGKEPFHVVTLTSGGWEVLVCTMFSRNPLAVGVRVCGQHGIFQLCPFLESVLGPGHGQNVWEP